MANTIMSTGQITLVDLTDERVSSFYLQANQSKIQVYDTNAKSYAPNYETANLVIDPFFFFGTEDYSSKLNSTNLSYTINGSPISGLSGVSQSGAKLTISKNINASDSTAPFNQDTLKIVATIKEKGITDEKTGLSNVNIITADIEFAKVSTGLQGSNGVGVSEVNQLYLLTSSSTEVPDTPDKNTLNWSETNPSWDNTKIQYLWICTETIYTNGSKTYSTPYTDSNWKTATEAVKSMEQSFDTLKTQVDTLQGEVDSAIETWYLEGIPGNSWNTYPWYDDTKDQNSQDDPNTHVGDLYYDIKSGFSYRFFKKEDGTYEWTRITDSDITKALDEVNKLQTVVDGKVTIYYDPTAPESTTERPLNKDDLWMPPNGNFYKWDGDSWELANEIIDRVEVQYNKNQSNTTPPDDEDTGWTTTAPEWEEGYYIWQRTATYYKEKTNPELSNPTCISVAGATGAAGADAVFAIVESISGKVIFTDNDNGDITLRAKLYIGGNEQETDVIYEWTSIPTGINGDKKELVVSRSQVPSARSFICKITYKGINYSDSIALSDKTDTIYCVIKSSNGDKFTNGIIDTRLTCHVFNPSGEIDTDGTKYIYTWEKYVNNNLDMSWNNNAGKKTGKNIDITSDDIDGKATFTCSLTLNSQGVI